MDLTEVVWQDFRKFAVKRKANEISSTRFWALTLEQLYREKQQPNTIATKLKEVLISFKDISTNRL